MSYETFENSIHDASPVEGYKFIGTFKTYRYTSAATQQTINGELYIPAPIKRTSVRAGTQEEESLALELSLPYDLEVVQDYAYAESPPKLVLEVYRVHRGTDFSLDAILFWKGPVSSYSVTDRNAKLRVPSIFSNALQGGVPNVFYQNPCNHVLYDGRCKVVKATFSTTTTTTDVGTNNIVVVDDGFADAFLEAGEIVNNRNGERRLILGNVANTISINFPFVDLQIGDEVTLSSGCDHSFTTCKNKFNNTQNYGGHPYIPGDSPFEGAI